MHQNIVPEKTEWKDESKRSAVRIYPVLKSAQIIQDQKITSSELFQDFLQKSAESGAFSYSFLGS